MFQRVNLSILRKKDIIEAEFSCASTIDVTDAEPTSTPSSSTSTVASTSSGGSSSDDSPRDHSE